MNITNEYSSDFCKVGMAERYARKFTNRVDTIRHEVELRVLKRYAYGKLFDCSIGTGRFISGLDVEYHGMDYSPEMIGYVNKHYPKVQTKIGDLSKWIEDDSCTYDTTICVRTLHAIDARLAISEMVRITKHGGLIIFDYGTNSEYALTSNGSKVLINYLNINQILSNFNVKKVAVHNLDSWLIRLLVLNKKWFYLFCGKYNFIGNNVWIWAERLLCQHGYRKLYILKKEM